MSIAEANLATVDEEKRFFRLSPKPSMALVMAFGFTYVIWYMLLRGANRADFDAVSSGCSRAREIILMALASR